MENIHETQIHIQYVQSSCTKLIYTYNSLKLLFGITVATCEKVKPSVRQQAQRAGLNLEK